MSSVRHVSGADFRYLFQNINRARIDTPRILNDLYASYHKKQIPHQFHDTQQGMVKDAKMNFKVRLNIIS